MQVQEKQHSNLINWESSLIYLKKWQQENVKEKVTAVSL